MQFLTLPFWRGTCAELIQKLDKEGGYLVVPSAPSLCQAVEDPVLEKAHYMADFAVMDSGYLDILLRLSGGNRPPRISGHQVIEHLLFEDSQSPIPFRERRVVWVTPSPQEESRIRSYLLGRGFSNDRQYFYNAPFYKSDLDFEDSTLAEFCFQANAQWIVICIGGGRQEKLGAYLRKELGKEVAIIATGAAIAFFSGGQAPIPRWADRLYLGWLIRTLHNPKMMLPRYAAAIKLPLALLRSNDFRKSP